MGSGNATVNVSDGGAIALFDAIQLGTTAGSKGTLRVSGTGSSLSSATGTMTVGGSGQGSLIVTEGGAVTAASLNVATLSGSRGEITPARPRSTPSTYRPT